MLRADILKVSLVISHRQTEYIASIPNERFKISFSKITK